MVGCIITKPRLDIRVVYQRSIGRSPSAQLYAPTKGLWRISTDLWGHSTLVVGGPQHQSLYIDLYIGKGGQYAIPSVCLCTLVGDAGLVATGEATPHTISP
jgi:hypothetical protein